LNINRHTYQYWGFQAKVERSLLSNLQTRKAVDFGENPEPSKTECVVFGAGLPWKDAPDGILYLERRGHQYYCKLGSKIELQSPTLNISSFDRKGFKPETPGNTLTGLLRGSSI
jgi:hypothetical protein